LLRVRGLEPDADEEPVYEYEPVVTDGDFASGFPVDFVISPTLLPPSLPFRFLTCPTVRSAPGARPAAAETINTERASTTCIRHALCCSRR
jgi:hypothetical protein